MMGPDWRIYYDGGALYDGDPWQAPALGVLVIVERDPNSGRRLSYNFDYYVWDAEHGRWWGVDLIGMLDYLIRPGPRRVLIGRLVSDETYTECYRRADSDADFPKRTNYGNRERKPR